MSQPWAADYVVSENLASELIASQFPEAGTGKLQLLGQGFDNTVYQSGNQYVFRFPRRQIAVELLLVENRLLPLLAARLPLAIPEPVFFGQPGFGFPWQFTGYRLVQGKTPGRLSEQQRIQSAAKLAGFLKILHEFPVDTAREIGIPADKLKRLDLSYRKPMLLDNIEKLKTLGLRSDTDSINEIVAAIEVTNYKPRTAVVHGDLHFRNLLIDEEGIVSGVIDWGDTHIGDPAIDLSIVYSLLPPAGRRQFFEVYGEVDEQTKQLARFVGIYIPVVLLLYGHDLENGELAAAAQEYLTLALTE